MTLANKSTSKVTEFELTTEELETVLGGMTAESNPRTVPWPEPKSAYDVFQYYICHPRG
jgi:hypothetical protein